MSPETFGQGDVFDDQRLAPTWRQPSLMDELDETPARERRRVRRLDDDRATGGDRGRHLMHDEVQRVIEGGNRADDADRFLGGECPAIPARRSQAHRDLAPGEMLQLAGGALDSVDRARRLGPRISGLPPSRAMSIASASNSRPMRRAR
jgi:hypothetical protein